MLSVFTVIDNFLRSAIGVPRFLLPVPMCEPPFTQLITSFIEILPDTLEITLDVCTFNFWHSIVVPFQINPMQGIARVKRLQNLFSFFRKAAKVTIPEALLIILFHFDSSQGMKPSRQTMRLVVTVMDFLLHNPVLIVVQSFAILLSALCFDDRP